MRMRGAVLLAFVLLSIAARPALSGCAGGSADCGKTLGVGGGILAGGYFGEPSHDWDLGMGGSLFIQTPLCCSFEGRLRASMVWNDGSGIVRSENDGPDLGPLPGDRLRSFRRSTYDLSLLWKADRCSEDGFAIPYLGAGISTYERRVEFLSNAGNTPLANVAPIIQTHSAWDWGFHGIGGMRFYRTSGLFVGLEGTFHAIDTPDEWTGACDISLLLGVELSR
jgi:hypothetical protein